jgi:hypothetical protein
MAADAMMIFFMMFRLWANVGIRHIRDALRWSPEYPARRRPARASDGPGTAHRVVLGRGAATQRAGQARPRHSQ